MATISDAPELTYREQMVLQYIIQNFIVSAAPIASATLASRYDLNVSPATIRSDMSSLESKGYLDHPHTSSGRIPTELGYRFYVNTLMKATSLSPEETKAIDNFAKSLIPADIDKAVYSGARLLARLSNLLAVHIAPKLADGIFRKMELINLSSSRLLVVLTIDSGLVRTINIEVESEINRKDLNKISTFLNERLSGHILKDIRKHIHNILADYPDDTESGLIRIFIDRADTIFEELNVQKFHFGGVEYMALQPEFSNLKNFKSIIEVIEQDDLIVHLFDWADEPKSTRAVIKIGSENTIPQMDHCSVVSANYKIGNAMGTIGLVGPTRMDYARMVSLVEQLAGRFNKPAES